MASTIDLTRFTVIKNGKKNKKRPSRSGSTSRSSIGPSTQSLAGAITKDKIALTTPPTRLIQSRLSLGQPTRISCPKCLMTYVPSSALDVKQHQKFHTLSLNGREWSDSWGTRLPGRFGVDNSDFIVRVDATSKSASKIAVQSFMELVNTQLSAPPENKSWKTRQGQAAAFIYVSKNRSVGVVTVERVEYGTFMDITCGVLLDQTAPAIMGVSRIFTCLESRRTGVATALLETARKHFIYGFEVPKIQVAWSQPSASGGRLASHWAGIKDEDIVKVMVYFEHDALKYQQDNW